MLSERTIINALILAAGLIIGPYLTIATFDSNYWPILIAGGVTFLLVAFFFIGNRICALPLLGLCFSGNLNFLPLGLDMGNVCIFVTILYYVATYIALKQKTFHGGPRAFFYPIMIILLILLYHQRTFGLHAFGGAKEGSRPAILMIACITAYICGINLANPPVAFLRRLPLYALAVTAFSNLPLLITTYVPHSANTLIYLSSNLNLGAYFGEEIVRGSALAAVGGPLQVILLAYFPIYTWWRPGRWWVIGLSLACFWCVAQGGYRSGMSLYFLSFIMGAWCHCSWRSLILLPPCIIVFLGLDIAQSSNLVSLPLSIQRSLAFLPGNWDKDVQESTISSNGFRDDIERTYTHEYAAQSPILGNGFTIDVNKVQEDMDKQGDPYYGIKVFLDNKLFHIGWISVYDAVGIVGSVAFVLLGVGVIYMSGRSIFTTGRERQSPLLPLRIYIFCCVTTDFVGYFTVFGGFQTSFTLWCAYGIVLAHLRQIERTPDMLAARRPEHELFGLPVLGTHGPVRN